MLLLDAHLLDLGFDEVRAELRAFRPDMTVLTTAPTYLFWRCPPPELRGVQQLAAAVRNDAGVLVAVGPHGSATPGPIPDKLGAGVVVMGECEEVLTHLADGEKIERPGFAPSTWTGPRVRRSTRPVRAKAAGEPRPCAPAAESLGSGQRGVAQPGSASALGAEGRWFESGRPDQNPQKTQGFREHLGKRRYLGSGSLGSDQVAERGKPIR